MKRTTARLVPSLSLGLTLALALLLPGLALGQAGDAVRSAPLAPAPDGLAAVTSSIVEPPARIAGGFGVEPLAHLAEAERGAADELAALAAWNRAGRRPVRTGIVRPLPLPRAVRFGGELASQAAGLHHGGAFVRLGSETTIWGASVEVAGAHRLRLHLDGVDLPAGTRMWVYGEDGQAVAFGTELVHEGSLWTPSVYGPAIRLEVEIPREALPGGGLHGLTVDRVAQIFRLGPDGSPLLEPTPLPQVVDTSCLVDVSCDTADAFSVVDLATRAIAHIGFVEGPFLFACTGGLLNLAADAPEGLQPPFLTANHCFSTQEAASSLEALWDYKTTSCDGTPPPVASLPRTFGATLLASNPVSDFTLLRLDLPPDRVLLGWNAENPVLPPGTVTHRLSHPLPEGAVLPQQYTRHRTLAENEILRCGTDNEGRATDDLTRFHHSVFLEGGSFGGSSGAPLILDNGQVVGQLLGACGSAETVNDGCSKENDEIDGNFFTTFDFVAQFLGAGAVPPPGEWHTVPDLPGFEFQARITADLPMIGEPVPLCSAGAFCASGAVPGRPEVEVRVIGPRPNGFLWVQIARFTPSRTEVWVRRAGEPETERYYDIEAVPSLVNRLPGAQDSMAFTP